MDCAGGWDIGVGVRVGLNSRGEELVNICIMNLHLQEL